MPEPFSQTAAAHKRVVIFYGFVVGAALLCWMQHRGLGSVRDTYATALKQLEAMRVDATEIQRLRQAPRAAVGRTRPSEELLAHVQQALAAAGIDRSRWQDSIPQPAVRLPKSDYKRLATRLYFDAVTLAQLARFSDQLQRTDPTLGISALHLTNRTKDRPEFDIEIAVSYDVYVPRRTNQSGAASG